jgi:prepilin-type N-terminal cleavage/methylation domain-containing protein
VPATTVTSSVRSDEQGFSLTEVLIATALLLAVFTAAIDGLRDATQLSRTIGNRSEMHASVRGATELMQQEIGQAGRVSLPGPVTLAGGALLGASTVAVSDLSGLFVGARVVVGAGQQTETVTVDALDAVAGTVTANFTMNHATGEPVQIFGGFGTGVVPPSLANGSSGNTLKIYGDINDDGQMLYVEYVCNVGTGNLYRNVMAWNAASKPALTEGMVLLNNIIANPDNSPCFTYQVETVATTPFVTGVAVTLSVRSQQRDVHSKGFQEATKTLLNVSPRNIFHVWTMASIGVHTRHQPMPPSVLALLPTPQGGS